MVKPKNVQAVIVSTIFWAFLLPLTLLLVIVRGIVQLALHLTYPNKRYVLASNIDPIFAHGQTGCTPITHQHLIHKGVPNICKIRDRYLNHVFYYKDGNYAQRLQRKFVREKWGWCVWEDCASTFNINDHVRLVKGLGSRVNEEDLLNFLSKIFQEIPSDDRPQWEHLIVPNYFPLENGDEPHYVSIVRIHHSYSDGPSLLLVIDGALGDSPLSWSVAPTTKPPILAKLKAYFSGPLSFLEMMFSSIKDNFNSPFICNGCYSVTKYLGWSVQLNMEFFKELASFSKTSFSSIVLTGIAGALRKHHLRSDAKRFEVEPGMDMNIVLVANMGSFEDRKMKNAFSAFKVPILYGDPNVVVRLKAVDVNLKSSARSSAPLFNFFMMNWTSLFPRRIQKAFGDVSCSGLLMSNVPGPSRKAYMFGSEIVDMGGMLPLLKNYGVGLVPFTYMNKLRLCFSADSFVVASSKELNNIFVDFQSEMEELGRLFNIQSKLIGN